MCALALGAGRAGALYGCRIRLKKISMTSVECRPESLEKANDSTGRNAFPVSFLHRNLVEAFLQNAGNLMWYLAIQTE